MVQIWTIMTTEFFFQLNRLGNCIKPLFIFSRQKNSGKRKRDLLPDNPMIKKNFGESRVSDLDKALEIDLNL